MGEQPLPKHGACNLGSINLSEFVKYPFAKDAYFDEDDFIEAVRIAIEALDIVLDENINNHALPKQKEMAEKYRNIGLGTMGMHDMFIKLGITYGSKESIEFIDSLMDLMFRTSVIKSSELAKEKGVFPNYNANLLKSHIIKNHFTDDELHELEIDKYGLRNCSLLSIAPTGSLGTMLNISTGCEPLFALYYTRKTESLNGGEDKYYKVYTGIAKEYMDNYGKELPEYFNTSKDINWKDRIDMQAALQSHIDTAISSTINLPNSATQEEIEKLYLYAWEKGLKGVTIFRDGCKRVGILSTDNSKKEDKENKEETTKAETTTKDNTNFSVEDLPRGVVINVDNDVIGKKRKLITGCGSLHCIALFDPTTGDLLETYLSKGSTGGCNNFMVGLSRMISTSARGGVDIYTIVDQLKSTGACPSYAVRSATKHDTSKGSCCPMAVGNALLDMYEELHRELFDDDDVDNEDNAPVKKVTTNNTVIKTTSKKNPCPNCGEELAFEGGCNICKNCGWSKCD